jgi:hypothetical protein
MAKGVDKRIEGLERFYGDNSPDEDKEREWVIGCAIMDEIASLRGGRVTNSYRGGTPRLPSRQQIQLVTPSVTPTRGGIW